jgi:hypothetical protein
MAHSQPQATTAANSTLAATNSFFFSLTPDSPLVWPDLGKSHYPLLLVAGPVILSLSLYLNLHTTMVKLIFIVVNLIEEQSNQTRKPI